MFSLKATRKRHGSAHPASLLFDALSDPLLYVYIPAVEPASPEELASRFARLERSSGTDERWLNWVMVDREEKSPVGTLQATVMPNGDTHIAYVVLPPRWRHGFGSEGVSWMLSHLDEVEDVSRFVALIDTRNVASIALIERLRFSRVARIENADHFGGCASHEYRYERAP